MNDGTPVEVGVYVPDEFSDTVQQIINFVMTSYKQDYDRNYARPYTNDRSFKYELMFLGRDDAPHPNEGSLRPSPLPEPERSYPWTASSNVWEEQRRQEEEQRRRLAAHYDLYGTYGPPPGPFTPPNPFDRPNPLAPPPNPFAPPNPFKK